MTSSYPSLLASGVSDLGRFDPFDLYAGESKIVTDQGQAADGQAIEQFQVLTYDNNGRLTPWLAPQEYAQALISFTDNPTSTDTVTINGEAIEFISALTTGVQVLIDADPVVTVASLVALINSDPDTYEVTAAVDSTGLIVTVSAIVRGVAGNAIALAESADNTTVSGATLSGATADRASGLVTFAGVPTANDTLTINGNAITFVSGAPSTHEVQMDVGGDTATTVAQDTLAEINAYPGLYAVTAYGSAATLALSAVAEGTLGDLVTLAKSAAVITLSGATMTGGAAAEDDVSKPTAIAAQPVDAATPGSYLPVFVGGIFNHQALVWPDAVATVSQRKAAFAGTPIGVRQLL
jgi:hypothetical protein